VALSYESLYVGLIVEHTTSLSARLIFHASITKDCCSHQRQHKVGKAIKDSKD
jgi:hypothetical protein